MFKKKRSLVDEAGMMHWVWRNWFSPKYAKAPWYVENIPPRHTLSHIRQCGSSPITVEQLTDMWHHMPYIRKQLEKVVVEPEVSAKANTLADTLEFSEMANSSEKLSKNMASKICHKATKKIFRLTNGINLEDLQDQQIFELMEQIDKTREEAAAAFAATLKSVKTTTELMEQLLRQKQVTKIDRRFCSEKELQLLMELSRDFTLEEIEQILLADLQEEENTFKLFQNAASHRLHPQKKRKKETDEDEEEEDEEEENESI